MKCGHCGYNIDIHQGKIVLICPICQKRLTMETLIEQSNVVVNNPKVEIPIIQKVIYQEPIIGESMLMYYKQESGYIKEELSKISSQLQKATLVLQEISSGTRDPIESEEVEKWINKIKVTIASYKIVLTGLANVLNSEEKLDFEITNGTLLKAASLGNASAMYLLGINYQRGIGVTKDYSKAYEWFYSAQKLGHKNAEFELERFEKIRRLLSVLNLIAN